jgi:hypothetical protein
MASRRDLNGIQFSEEHIVRGTPVRIISPESMVGLRGTPVNVHMHTPATKALGEPIYSVLDNSRLLIGHSKNISLENASMAVDARELKKHLENPTKAKTRNTFVRGTVGPNLRGGNPLKIRPGSMTDLDTGEDVSENLGRVNLGKQGARYKR